MLTYAELKRTVAALPRMRLPHQAFAHPDDRAALLTLPGMREPNVWERDEADLLGERLPHLVWEFDTRQPAVRIWLTTYLRPGQMVTMDQTPETLRAEHLRRQRLHELLLDRWIRRVLLVDEGTC